MSELVFVFSNAVDGRDDEYNAWYNNVHLQEVAAVKGIRCAQRFTLSDTQIQEQQGYRYLAIYEVEDEIGAADAVKNMLADAENMNMSDSIDTDNAYVTVMQSVTGRVMGDA